MKELFLRFTPYAWAKLIWFRDKGRTEIGGFGITNQDDPLLVEDIAIIKQTVSSASVEFDDTAVANHFEDMFDMGIQPINCGRVWIHTHPAGLNRPSGTDEQTFSRVFGKCDWAVMFILPKENGFYCRLESNIQPAHAVNINYMVDYTVPFSASCHEEWEEEYKENVIEKKFTVEKTKKKEMTLHDFLAKKARELDCTKEQRPSYMYEFDEDDSFLAGKEARIFGQKHKSSLYEEELIDCDFEEEMFSFSAPKTKPKRNKK
jgi:hypothetical protein